MRRFILPPFIFSKVRTGLFTRIEILAIHGAGQGIHGIEGSGFGEAGAIANGREWGVASGGGGMGFGASFPGQCREPKEEALDGERDSGDVQGCAP